MSSLSQFAGGDPLYWVSGTTYALGKSVRSPTDHQRYVRIIAGAGATDPASDATNWRPDGGRTIKSIQRGVITIATGINGLSTATATISSVNTAKTELRNLGVNSSYNGGTSSSAGEVALTNATTITATIRSTSTDTGIRIGWELTEFY